MSKAITSKPLINKNLLNSRLKSFSIELTKEQITIAENWANTSSDPSFLEEIEISHQGEFLTQVFGTLLGYKTYVGNQNKHNLKIESSSKQTKGGKRPDGSLGFYTKEKETTKVVIELKAPGANLDAKQHGHGGLTPVEQGFGYVSKFEGCKWVIISNFINLRLYYCDKSQASWHEFLISELSNKETLKQFIFLLEKSNLISDTGKASKIEQLVKTSSIQEIEITKNFYNYYKNVRDRLFKQLCKDNQNSEDLNDISHANMLLEKAQKLLDRILFICFCEDTGLLPFGIIRSALESASSGFVKTTRWEQLVGLFNAIDKGHSKKRINAYNGGLFKTDSVLDNLIVSPELLDDLLQFSDYDFESDLNVNILGHIFEQSISDLEKMRFEIRGETKEKSSTKRKKEGVFYTPEYITTYIIENTVGKWLEGKFHALSEEYNPEKVRGKHKKLKTEINLWEEYQIVLRKINILDPACGSGAFLISAFDYLYSEYRMVNNKLAELRGGQRSIEELDKLILQNNLYGVDLNSESVEITKLSLWLKTARKDKPLNNLENNIKCGNSLISPPTDQCNSSTKAIYTDLSSNIKEHAFNWREHFPKIMDNGGFDCIVGNPPYIRQEWIAPYKPYLGNKYASYSGTADLYLYFIEQGLKLLSKNGFLGMITSGTFSRANFAKPFRKWLPSIARYHQIVNFGENQPFKDAEMVYPTISILKKTTTLKNCDSLFLHDHIPLSLQNEMSSIGIQCDNNLMSKAEWTFQSNTITNIFSKVFNTGEPLKTVVGARIYNGVKTGFNEAFIIDSDVKTLLTKKDSRSNEIIKPILRGQDLRPLYYKANEQWLIFTRRGIDIDDYPAIKQHLENYRQQLEPKPKDFKGKWPGRKSSNYQWYEIEAPFDYYNEFQQHKIMCPEIGKLPRFSLDHNGVFMNNKVYFLVPDSPGILGILQSRLIWFCISQISTPLRLRGGLWQFQCFKQFLQRLPIPRMEKTENKVFDKLSLNLTELSKSRYQLNLSVLNRISSDLNSNEIPMSNKMKTWFTLSFSDFHKEVKKTFNCIIPLNERNDWEIQMNTWKKEFDIMTDNIVSIQKEIDERIYGLFSLSPSEIKELENHMITTKIYFPYGEF